MWELIYEHVDQRGRLPNPLSRGIGNAIRQAREEAGLSQTELANAVYKRRASISEIENGKMYPDIETLTYISRKLNKPLLYFIPEKYRQHVYAEESTPEDSELLMLFRKLPVAQKRVAIAQIKALVDMEV
ncbi:helix-turn-helix transcriptional regulator [Phototrophicus methaneseepsis]|uniref:Helix-turn-helix transcriptional regulator n=1 Tax=Phototrophicus methaneseepsis TaxID=2710758 RepID=A0A7S8IE55_9CHLR|nr:helix-turn-helix transcriptional regulator [Phototrophicus methaneseepsis]QPC82064.1 helix-turn-helix transcriptional regulator [Phototrophicus methaneseepsis]